ncbi:MAG: hypothetical protein GDA45_00815 [Chromatiales bacterium]|nr:hypothetical protein [Chromatiales bacterium]
MYTESFNGKFRDSCLLSIVLFIERCQDYY